MRRVLPVLALGFLCLLAAGCGEEAEEGADAPAWPLSKERKRGPVTVVVRCDRERLTIAEQLRFELVVIHDEVYGVEFPTFGEKLEQFGIVDYAAPPARLVGEGRVEELRRYVLEPFLSGEYTIPPLTIRFARDGEEEGHVVETEALTVKVTSLLPEAVAELAIEDILPPQALPRQAPAWLLPVALGALLVLGGAAGMAVWLARRAGRPGAVIRTAHEIAYDQLEALLAEQLVEAGAIKAFYLRLSNILRHYIENRFALRAPEQTTEEFLHALRESGDLDVEHKQVLREFLQHCDLVKFAEHQPEPAEIQATFDTCKRFIFETEVHPEA